MLSTKQVAQRLNVAENTVRSLIEKGQLPAIRVGKLYRVDEADLRASIETRRLSSDGAVSR